MIVSLLLFLIIALGMYVTSRRLSGIQLIAAITMLSCGAILVVFPNVTSYVAERLGVGRGTDLLLYFSIIGGMFIASHLYFQIRRQQEAITRIVMELALLKAHNKNITINPYSNHQE